MNDNKLIAEFMGFQKTDIGWYESNDGWFIGLSNSGNTFDEYELSFDTSWDWLMPVVEKISDIKHWSINATLEWLSEEQDRDGLYSIKDVNEAVVKFIEEGKDVKSVSL